MAEVRMSGATESTENTMYDKRAIPGESYQPKRTRKCTAHRYKITNAGQWYMTVSTFEVFFRYNNNTEDRQRRNLVSSYLRKTDI